MVHDFYMTLVLTDSADPVGFAYERHRTVSGKEDVSLVTLEWSDGTMTLLFATFLTPSGMYVDGFDRLEVFGRGWVGRATPVPRPLEIWDDRARYPLNMEILVEGDAPRVCLRKRIVTSAVLFVARPRFRKALDTRMRLISSGGLRGLSNQRTIDGSLNKSRCEVSVSPH